tara:strand:+ start:7963 stop:8166 length:204 start_codon:yes stop_codon:yes gene_type:complete
MSVGIATDTDINTDIDKQKRLSSSLALDLAQPTPVGFFSQLARKLSCLEQDTGVLRCQGASLAKSIQ